MLTLAKLIFAETYFAWTSFRKNGLRIIEEVEFNAVFFCLSLNFSILLLEFRLKFKYDSEFGRLEIHNLFLFFQNENQAIPPTNNALYPAKRKSRTLNRS